MRDPAIRHEFPFGVESRDPVWIALADGARLAATLWRPITRARAPVVVEMLPYRRRDGTVFRDREMHPYIAGHGIACLRVDIRGTGDSGGILEDEYTPLEQRDALEVIAWAAAQAWCTGAVGMTGISWGGFNSLQTAALRPPALKAIITVCASDDRYADDVHYMGGALLTEDAMWSTFMLANNALPPDPQIVGERWRAMWRERLEASRSWSERWMRHPRRDAYWKQGSVCEDYSRIEAAVLAVCGWEDSYSNFVPRLLAGLSCPKRAIVGPWSHHFPCRGDPGPRIGYLQEALRWWKHWLCGQATGIMDEPLFRVWIGESERPRPWYETHAGRWAAEEEWPSPRILQHKLWLNASGLEADPRAGPTMRMRSPATAGTDYGRWGGYGGTSPDLAIDQRRDDGLALCFDTPPLAEDITLLGAAELDLLISVDQPRVTLTARLCDVAPEGESAVFTYGVLNLGHRHSHEQPELCPVGEPFRVRMTLNDTGRTIPKGHRLRLALQTQFWFVLWPHPQLCNLSMESGASSLVLPIRPDSPLDAGVRFATAEIAPPLTVTMLRQSHHGKTVEDDLATGIRIIRLVNDHGRALIEDRAIEVEWAGADTFSIQPEDPLTARLETQVRASYKSGKADVAVEARSVLTSDAGTFQLNWRLEAREAQEMVFEREETVRIPRDE